MSDLLASWRARLRKGRKRTTAITRNALLRVFGLNLSWCLRSRGRHVESITASGAAWSLDSSSLIFCRLGQISRAVGGPAHLCTSKLWAGERTPESYKVDSKRRFFFVKVKVEGNSVFS